MPVITQQALPDDALLASYQSRGYVDCFSTVVARDCTLATFVEAFYTTRLFRLERMILRIALSRPSSDADAHRIATAQSGAFAAWQVEARNTDQLLLCDVSQRTRSWFAIAAQPQGTQLRFGSAVVATNDRGDLGIAGSAPVLRLHQWYSRSLLAAAARRLTAQ